MNSYHFSPWKTWNCSLWSLFFQTMQIIEIRLKLRSLHHGLSWNHFHKSNIIILQELGLILKLFTRSPVNLGQDLRKFDNNVGGMVVKHWNSEEIERDYNLSFIRAEWQGDIEEKGKFFIVIFCNCLSLSNFFFLITIIFL